MYAALFELESWLGLQKYIFEGESASEIFNKFERVQDLSCLVRMGRGEEGKRGQKQLDKLEAMLEKYYSGELEMADLAAFNIKISLGAMACTAVAEGEEAIAKLKADHPDAR